MTSAHEEPSQEEAVLRRQIRSLARLEGEICSIAELAEKFLPEGESKKQILSGYSESLETIRELIEEREAIRCIKASLKEARKAKERSSHN